MRQPGSRSRSTASEAAGPPPPLDDDASDAERVYRPLLFQSADYASSELFRDAFEMRARLQQQQQQQQQPSPLTTAAAALSPCTSTVSSSSPASGTATPRIRLETLSSRAASSVLAVTYLAFALALLSPYLQSRGFLGAAVTLPGALCDGRVSPHEPCIVVDRTHGLARWSGFVRNVSRFAGSVALALDIRNASTLLLAADKDDTDSAKDVQLQPMDAQWQRWHHPLETGEEEDEDNVVDQSFVLTYDAFLYGVDVDTTPATKVEIAAERDQSVWVDCPSAAPASACNRVTLLDVSQEVSDQVRDVAVVCTRSSAVDGLTSYCHWTVGGGYCWLLLLVKDGNGFDAYLVVVEFRGAYPNEFGQHVSYEFSYTCVRNTDGRAWCRQT